MYTTVKAHRYRSQWVSKNPTCSQSGTRTQDHWIVSDTLTTRPLPPGVSKIVQCVINPVTEENSIHIK